MLNNREIAVLVWLGVFLAWAVSQAKIREAILGVLRAALTWKIVVPVLMMATYVALVVLGLRELGFWDLNNLKATVLWFLTAGLVMIFDIKSVPSDEHYFQKAILDGFKVSVVLEFIVGFYVLTLILELLLIPTATIFTCILVLVESREELKSLRSPLNTLMASLGFGLLAYALYRLSTDFASFANMSTVVEFLLPILLTLFFLPSLYVLAAWASYETWFVRLQFFMDDPELRRFTKIHLIRTCWLNFRAVNRWGQRFLRERPRTREEVLASLQSARNSA